MGKKYLVDTNTLIDAQIKRLPEKGLKLLASIIDEDFTVSFVTYIEFLGYPNATRATEDFISLARVLEINVDIINKCINLRRARRIKLPDAIIAATALSYDLTIITNNEKDFLEIAGLEVINLHKI